jgi:transcriptional regulator with XRE-family HTH domain
MIQIAIQIEGTQKAFAEKAGVSQQYLVDVLKGRRSVGAKLLEWFGLERVVSYKRVDGGNL